MQGTKPPPLSEPCHKRWGMACQIWDRVVWLQSQELKAQRDLQRPGKPGKQTRGLVPGSAEEGYQLLEQQQEADSVIQSNSSLGV